MYIVETLAKNRRLYPGEGKGCKTIGRELKRSKARVKKCIRGKETSQRYMFFFQAEAGIRADLVTGVQTCALPIFLAPVVGGYAAAGCRVIATASAWRIANMQIGRASCRERVEMSVVGGA